MDELLAAQCEARVECLESDERVLMFAVIVGDHFRKHFIFCQHDNYVVSDDEETARRWAKHPETWCYHCGKDGHS